jgi:hypothetical protein
MVISTNQLDNMFEIVRKSDHIREFQLIKKDGKQVLSLQDPNGYKVVCQ